MNFMTQSRSKTVNWDWVEDREKRTSKYNFFLFLKFADEEGIFWSLDFIYKLLPNVVCISHTFIIMLRFFHSCQFFTWNFHSWIELNLSHVVYVGKCWKFLENWEIIFQTINHLFNYISVNLFINDALLDILKLNSISCQSQTT